MKAITIQQPFAFEIMSGRRTIEARDWDTLHRGDLLVCSSRRAAFPSGDMEELEDEYGCVFLYGQALCVANLADVRPMKKGDEDKALVDRIDPEAFSWVFEDVRPVVPFAVKGRDGLFDVEDNLVETSPFRYGDPVVVKRGILAKDFGLDFSGWHGRAMDVQRTEDGETRVRVEWDSLSLRDVPLPVIEQCEREGFDWTGVLLRIREIGRCRARDTVEDVQNEIESIIEDNSEIFQD